MTRRIRVPYAGGWAEPPPPAVAQVEILEPADLPAEPEEEVLERALLAPDTAAAFSALAAATGELVSGKPLTIVVNDATRPTPSGRALAHLASRGLLPARPERRQVRVLVATGSHRGGSREDARRILEGDLDPAWFQVLEWHDARAGQDHVSLGKTSRGTPLSLDRRVLASGALLLINSVEPHYFAGYTGGRKSLMPGLSAHATIEANHRLALDPASDVLRLEGNPVHEDAEEAVSLLPLPLLLSVQLVLDRRQRIAYASAGSLRGSFLEAVAEADRRYVAPLAQPADIVITVAAPPMDYDLYQSQKAVENAARAVRDGGVLLLVSSCRNGIGDRGYFDLLSSCSSPVQVRSSVESCYVLGYHKADRLAAAADRIHLLSVTGLPDQEMKAAFFEPFHDLQSALEQALDLAGQDARIAVLPDGCVTVPRVEPPRRQP